MIVWSYLLKHLNYLEWKMLVTCDNFGTLFNHITCNTIQYYIILYEK